LQKAGFAPFALRVEIGVTDQFDAHDREISGEKTFHDEIGDNDQLDSFENG
jgi:hypothetical protein